MAWWGLALGFIYMAVSHTRRVPPPLGDGCSFSFGFNSLAVGWVGLLSNNNNNNNKTTEISLRKFVKARLNGELDVAQQATKLQLYRNFDLTHNS